MELENKIEELGAASNMQVSITVNEIVEQMEEAKGMAWRIRQKNTAYEVGDKVIVPGVSNFDKILRCESAGTTANDIFPENYDALEVGQIVRDGTIEWGVVDLVTIPNIEDAPVTSVNGETGDVNLTAKKVGATPSSHPAKNASVEELGHVKVDGKTITIDDDGTIKAFTGYLPLTGGTMTGGIVFDGDGVIKRVDNRQNLILLSGTSWSNSSHIILRGAGLPETDVNYPNRGEIMLAASSGDAEVKILSLKPNGELIWCEKQVVCVESWRASDGLSWYRKYSDGWVEQGGIITANGYSTGVALTFPVEFADTKFRFFTQCYYDPDNSSSSAITARMTPDTKSANGGIIIASVVGAGSAKAYNGEVDWIAFGKAATA